MSAPEVLASLHPPAICRIRDQTFLAEDLALVRIERPQFGISDQARLHAIVAKGRLRESIMISSRVPVSQVPQAVEAIWTAVNSVRTGTVDLAEVVWEVL